MFTNKKKTALKLSILIILFLIVPFYCFGGITASNPLNFRWNAVTTFTDGSPCVVDGYRLYRNGELIETYATDILNCSTTSPGGVGIWYVKCFKDNIESEKSNTLEITILDGAPSPPLNLRIE